MPNAFIPRDQVHAWSESIGDEPEKHQAALTRLLKDQRRLTRFIEQNAEELGPMSGGVTVYLMGVIVRMFDLAGGRLKSATWAQIRDAEKRVHSQIESLLPLDETLPERARNGNRAQPHILDEALRALFEREPESDDEADLDPAESIKTYLLLWVAVDVLDQNWKPAKDFEGQDSYEYVHIPVEKSDDSSDD